ncbi:hypothetical protein GCM10011390_37920 [Aureimonas endophytica]|uniref:Hedgehog/Intein (Hint) domain-containing protein n=1 Tax=Aureimonas endophytica TaxID=2027858 RepID=A0A917E8R6_9HYPH|nr:Hint domain-containing protein [Aureimonas endophytica]GGE15242.1 hypothetical protein GCM10011390_37920 [Aureimonas endophytica]
MSSKDTDQSSSGDSESLDSKDRSGGSGAAGVLMSGGLAASSTLSNTSDAKAESAAGGTATAQGPGAAERGADGASAARGEGNGAGDTAASGGGGAAASGSGATMKQAAGGLSGGTGTGIGSRDSSGGNGASARGESGGRGGEAGAAGTGSGASASSASSEGGGTGSGSSGGEGSGSGTGETGTGSGGGGESGASSATSSGGGGSSGDAATAAANGGGAGGSSSDSGSAGSIGTASASGGGTGSNGASPFSAGSTTHGAADGPASILSSPIGATSGGDAFSPVTPVCFCPGTLIATPSGAVAVEDLRPGDQVRLADGGAETVRWIGRQTVEAGTGDPLRTLPIRIRAGAIAPGVPARDLRLSPDHAVAIDGVLIHAGALVDGTAVLRERDGPARLRYFHIELPRHALVLAEGLAAESFVDNPERLAFDNWAEREALEDGARAIAEMDLPRAKSARQVPGAIRRRLAARRALLPQAERALVA